MRTLDEKLYHACLNYCQALTEYMCRRNEFNSPKPQLYTSVERERILDMEEKKLRHYYTSLLEIIQEMEEPLNENL